MKSFVRFVAMITGLGFGHVTMAAEAPANHHFGIGYFQNSNEFDFDDGSVSAELDSVMMKYGWNLMKFVGVEAHFGFSDKTVDDSNQSVTNDYLVGIFARGSLPMQSQNITLYGLIGMSQAKSTFTPSALTTLVTGVSSYSTTATGISYGVGIELFGTPKTSAHIEWMKYLSKTDFTSSGFVLGVTHHFSMSKLW